MTQNVTNYSMLQNRIVNRSLSVDQVERVVQRPLPRYRIVDRDTVLAPGDRVRGNEVYMFRRTLAEVPTGRFPKTEAAPRQARGPGQRPGAAPAAPKSMIMPELVQRQEAERRELLSHQQNQRTRLEQEHRREIQQPPKGKSIADLRIEHEAERRDLEENSRQGRLLLQRRHERERKAIGAQ